ncbi:15073_t:CDS:2 [Acaulospora colombiana]|uniref:15073_t:CDS:1 n=1 Tax=Acaulospora colombiana TaxID=27376 RepID=A0ACA9L7W5_9GLOM|nr:15073_t:CDS:2 [Acaulospora colombiana]
MSKRLGELVVIAIKARNLSTREMIGKADPFVTFRIGDISRRIKADKRGGQHPNWDEEVRFQITDELSNKKMKVQVYNEDAREHELVGETTIELKEVLEKGEMDDWFEIKFRNKPAGEVYLEMTFYNTAEPPPAPIRQQVPPMNQTVAPPRTQTPPYSYPPTNNQYIPSVPNNAPTSSPASYPSNAYPPNDNIPGRVLSPPLHNSPLPHYAAPQSQTTAPYPQNNSTPYPPVSQVNPLSTSSQGTVSFPVPVPTPNHVPSVGGYPPFNGYPPVPDYNSTSSPPSIGDCGVYKQLPYPPNNNNVYPPTSNPNFYPPTSNPNFYPPTSNPNFYPPANNANFYPPNIYPPPNDPNIYSPPNTYPPPNNNNNYPPTSGQGYHPY